VCGTRLPRVQLSRRLTWEEGEVAGGTAAPSLGLLSVGGEALLEVLSFEYFSDDLCDLLIHISLAKQCDARSSAKAVCCVNTVTEQATLQQTSQTSPFLWDLGC